MKILILVALIAIAAADVLLNVTPKQEELIQTCAKTFKTAPNVALNLRSGNFKGEVYSEDDKKFLQCYLNACGIFNYDRIDRVEIMRNLKEAGKDTNPAEFFFIFSYFDTGLALDTNETFEFYHDFITKSKINQFEPVTNDLELE